MSKLEEFVNLFFSLYLSSFKLKNSVFNTVRHVIAPRVETQELQLTPTALIMPAAMKSLMFFLLHCTMNYINFNYGPLDTPCTERQILNAELLLCRDFIF